MNKRALIISPHFPPVNAADMQRVRMSLPYFADHGWDVEIVCVNEKYIDLAPDYLLLQSLPKGVKIHKVKAFNKNWTSKIGFGAVALRSLWFYRREVNTILKSKKFDLIYFSTTQFPVCVLGAYWKRRFNMPYVIDMQDPWYSNYYDDKPKSQRPAKYHVVYALHKYLERKAMNYVDGLISVSPNYVAELKNRYPRLEKTPSAIITFGAFEPDIKIAQLNEKLFIPILDTSTKNMVYIGRGGADLYNAITPVFKALAIGLTEEPESFKQLRFYFIGTSYTPDRESTNSIMPLAKQLGVEGNVIEIPARISYYHTLITLKQADALFIPGSDHAGYTASKIYPYLLTQKPLLAIFNSKSPALDVLQEYNAPFAYSYDKTPGLDSCISRFLNQVINDNFSQQSYSAAAIKKYDAKNMTAMQCQLFNQVLKCQK